ncbi:MAG: hypothetical protein DI586_08190 [Micavibrio aeruginosavorus]|uniref:GIY-YIG domain-containing protein n=1 Tax=Micavibrio aeruginosavorus TaxID=349221 RepID=A0A2W5HA99_9BACT|nr:MAG: hypothetical protein DI586_08190 [Micavibrio aeruginosavorus]
MAHMVYILTNKSNEVLYTGVTSDLPRRIHEHKAGLVEGFSKKYNTRKLIYAESFGRIEDAIHREKCIKRWKREWKIRLIEESNPEWDELSVI